LGHANLPKINQNKGTTSTINDNNNNVAELAVMSNFGIPLISSMKYSKLFFVSVVFPSKCRACKRLIAIFRCQGSLLPWAIITKPLILTSYLVNPVGATASSVDLYLYF
jgi:hypothetical protein